MEAYMKAQITNIIQFGRVRRRSIGRRPSKYNGNIGSALGKGLSDMVMQSLTAQFAEPTNERGLRDRALFLTMTRTALRAAEVVSLRWSNLIQLPEGPSAFRVRVKGGRTHLVIPGDEAIAAVRAYHVAARIISDGLFHSLPNRALSGVRSILSTRGLQKIVNRWSVRTGTGKPVHPHAMRHTAVQKAFDLAGSIAAQKLAGHSSPVVTARHYTRPYFDGSIILSW